MKVLVVCHSLRLGGAESMSVSLANALSASGLNVFFASADGELRGNLGSRVRFLVTENPGHGPSRVTHELLQYMKHYQFDVVHAQGATCAVTSAIADRAAKTQSIRVVTHHSNKLDGLPRWLAAPIIRRVADQYIAVSPEKVDELKAMGIRPEKISLIPNFVDVDSIAVRVESVERAPTLRTLGIPEGARVLMMGGPMIETKRFDQFVRIAAEVARRMPDREIHALAVGDGPELNDVRRVAAREGAPAKIHFTGYQRDILPYLAVSDVVVFPSEHDEVLPMFLIEASAAARPIVCSDIAGNREIVTDGVTGCLAREGVPGYAAAVVDLLRHPERGALYAHAAQQRAQERFDRPAVAREVVELYQRLLAAKHPTR